MFINIDAPMTYSEIKRLHVLNKVYIVACLLVCSGAVGVLLGYFSSAGFVALCFAMMVVGFLTCITITVKTGLSFKTIDDFAVLYPSYAEEMSEIFNDNPELAFYREEVIRQGRNFYMFELRELPVALSRYKKKKKFDRDVRRLYGR